MHRSLARCVGMCSHKMWCVPQARLRFKRRMGEVRRLLSRELQGRPTLAAEGAYMHAYTYIESCRVGLRSQWKVHMHAYTYIESCRVGLRSQRKVHVHAYMYKRCQSRWQDISHAPRTSHRAPRTTPHSLLATHSRRSDARDVVLALRPRRLAAASHRRAS